MPTYAKRADARLPVRVPADLLNDVKELARAEEESVSTTVRRILREAVRAARREREARAGAP